MCWFDGYFPRLDSCLQSGIISHINTKPLGVPLEFYIMRTKAPRRENKARPGSVCVADESSKVGCSVGKDWKIGDRVGFAVGKPGKGMGA